MALRASWARRRTSSSGSPKRWTNVLTIWSTYASYSCEVPATKACSSRALLALVLGVVMSSSLRMSSSSISLTPSCGTESTTFSAATAMAAGSSPSSMPSDSAPSIVGMREDSESPATSAKAASARALDADMGGADSCGTRKGRMILPRRVRSCCRPLIACPPSSSRPPSRAGTTSSIALWPSCLYRASNARADEARTSAASSHSAVRTVVTRSSRKTWICCLVQFATTSATPRHTPARWSSSSEASDCWRIGTTSGRARSPILLTSSPIARPATACFSGLPQDKHSMRVSISVGRMVRRVRSWLCTTLFHTWNDAWHTVGATSLRSM
mmetsp:Transcript_15338/g.39018  ORF Transcript_15338/g.39018 Transcript_15338/m.39018 type:complete len:328 (+) Transcript_15338:867-1850(+)